MLKEILREIQNYFEDVEHDRALAILSLEYSNVLSVHGKNEKLKYFEIHSRKEGNLWHYIRQGVYSYLAKKKRKEMQGISKENDNHCVSGGFIFDKMDRFAHDFLKKKYNVKGYLFTKSATIKYMKQICDWNSMGVFDVFYAQKQGSYDYRIKLELYERETGITYAVVTFDFVEKDHAYCDKGN